MKLKINIFFLFLSLLTFSFQAKGETASEILTKASNTIKGAKGVNVTYKLTSGGNSLSGSLKSSGSKFYVKAGGMESWYNGKSLYTYNPSTKEATVVSPTASDLAEVNPLLYMGWYNKYFDAVFSQNKQSGKYIIDLKSKSRKAPAKKITVFLNSKTSYPEKFIITSPSGDVTTVKIDELNVGKSLSSSLFEYPAKRMYNIKLIDLR